jgi:hypothetical protein
MTRSSPLPHPFLPLNRNHENKENVLRHIDGNKKTSFIHGFLNPMWDLLGVFVW